MKSGKKVAYTAQFSPGEERKETAKLVALGSLTSVVCTWTGIM